MKQINRLRIYTRICPVGMAKQYPTYIYIVKTPDNRVLEEFEIYDSAVDFCLRYRWRKP